MLGTIPTFLPWASVTFRMMESAQGVATVISAATITGVGEHYILVFVITNPLAAAFGLG